MKAKICVVGAGTYGSVLINAFYGAHMKGEIEFAGVADINQNTLDEINKKYGIKGYLDYKQMLDEVKPDAVSVVTPDFLHEQVVLEAAKRKIHVMCQKPLSTDIEASKRMVKACKDNNVMLYVDFHKRFDPGHISLKSAIDTGKMGKIEYGYVCMEDKILVPTEWFKSWNNHSSPAWFIGIHFYDLIYWLLGEKPNKVFATGHKWKLKEMGFDTYDSIEAKFMFPSGATITVDSSWILPNNFSAVVNQQIRLVGTEGMQEVDSEYRGVIASYRCNDMSLTLNPYGRLDVLDPVAGMIPTGYTITSMLNFLRLVNRMKNEGLEYTQLNEDYPTGDQAVVSTVMCQMAHESAEKGTILDIVY